MCDIPSWQSLFESCVLLNAFYVHFWLIESVRGRASFAFRRTCNRDRRYSSTNRVNIFESPRDKTNKMQNGMCAQRRLFCLSFRESRVMCRMRPMQLGLFFSFISFIFLSVILSSFLTLVILNLKIKVRINTSPTTFEQLVFSYSVLVCRRTLLVIGDDLYKLQ